MSRLSAAAVAARKAARFPVVTAYDAPFARAAAAAGIDVILVGDSLGMVVLGYDSTTPVELEDMIRHAGAVVRGAPNAHVIVDLPFGTYEVSDAQAVENAIAIVKRSGGSSVKLEGAADNAARIRAITGAGIPVCAHLGVLPQTAGMGTGFRRQRDRERLLHEAEAAANAGAFGIVLEMVDEALAVEITARVPVVTIGIGSGGGTDGQVIVMHDVLGLYPEPPPFAKQYATLGADAATALRTYADDVRSGAFPPARAARTDAAPYRG